MTTGGFDHGEFRRMMDELTAAVDTLVLWWGGLTSGERSAYESGLVAEVEEVTARLQEFTEGLEATEWE